MSCHRIANALAAVFLLSACAGPSPASQRAAAPPAQPAAGTDMPRSAEAGATASAVPTLASSPTLAPTATQTRVALPVVQSQMVTYTYRVITSYPHDPGAFTQGLVFYEGAFFESTGLNGRSSLRHVEIETGRVLRRIDIDQQYFAEGLALVDGELLQLTWQNKVGFVYDAATFERKRSWPYASEGWGLAYDGNMLVMSDGTPTLRFLDSKTLSVTREITVMLGGVPQAQLNELEIIDGTVWANIWQTDLIVQIDPQSGNVLGILNLAGLLKPEDRVLDQ